MAKKGHDLNIEAALPSGAQLEDVLKLTLNGLYQSAPGDEEVIADAPDDFIPVQFLTACLLGAPSGEEEETWSLHCSLNDK